MGGRRGEGQEEGKGRRGRRGGQGQEGEGRARSGRGPLLGPEPIINKAKCYFSDSSSNKQKKYLKLFRQQKRQRKLINSWRI